MHCSYQLKNVKHKWNMYLSFSFAYLQVAHVFLPIFRMTFQKIKAQNLSSHKWAMYMYYVYIHTFFKRIVHLSNVAVKKL